MSHPLDTPVARKLVFDASSSVVVSTPRVSRLLQPTVCSAQREKISTQQRQTLLKRAATETALRLPSSPRRTASHVKPHDDKENNNTHKKMEDCVFVKVNHIPTPNSAVAMALFPGGVGASPNMFLNCGDKPTRRYYVNDYLEQTRSELKAALGTPETSARKKKQQQPSSIHKDPWMDLTSAFNAEAEKMSAKKSVDEAPLPSTLPLPSPVRKTRTPNKSAKKSVIAEEGSTPGNSRKSSADSPVRKTRTSNKSVVAEEVPMVPPSPVRKTRASNKSVVA
eukprot:PhF_6_TR1464/c1_g1_i1/m.2637